MKNEFGGTFLKLEEIDEERAVDDVGRYTVSKQALRTLSFNMGTDTFSASNGWHIVSAYHPDLDIRVKRLGVWGSDQSEDGQEIAISDSNVDDIVLAVNEYNEHMEQLLNPTAERLCWALGVIAAQNRRTAESDGYRITKMNEIMKKAPADTKVITELIKELVKSVFNLPLDECCAISQTPDLTAWVDPGNNNVRHIVSYWSDDGGMYSTVFKGEGQSGQSKTTRLLSPAELKSLFKEQPIPFLAACCLSKRFQNGSGPDPEEEGGGGEEGEDGEETEERHRRTGGRDFWRV